MFDQAHRHAAPTSRPALVLLASEASQMAGPPDRRIRFGLAFGWVLVAGAFSLTSPHALAGGVLIVAIVATEVFAASDDFGSKAFSGLISMLALLLLGWAGGLVIGTGSVFIGDALLRRKPLSLVAWWAFLLAAMLTASAWSVGVTGTRTAGAWAPRAVGAASFAVFTLWTARRLRRVSEPHHIAAGASILAVIGAALAGPFWMPHVSASYAPWAGAGMGGLGVAAAFMLCDVVVASAAGWRTGGRFALAFWDEHLPILFLRYATQGVIAGVIAYWYVKDGTATLFAILVGVVTAQSLYFVYRRAEGAVESAVSALSSAIDARDPYTAGHSIRVADYATRVALHLGWSKARVEQVRRAGLLHDVGKLGVADAVLHKPGKLDDAEFAQMKRHAAVGATIVSQVQGLRLIAKIVGQDHERWEGGGYPTGLVGEAILPAARLIAVADVYDAMTTSRPYRDALPESDVLCHLEAESGRQLDPGLTAAFLRVVHEESAAGVMFCYCATH